MMASAAAPRHGFTNKAPRWRKKKNTASNAFLNSLFETSSQIKDVAEVTVPYAEYDTAGYDL